MNGTTTCRLRDVRRSQHQTPRVRTRAPNSPADGNLTHSSHIRHGNVEPCIHFLWVMFVALILLPVSPAVCKTQPNVPVITRSAAQGPSFHQASPSPLHHPRYRDYEPEGLFKARRQEAGSPNLSFLYAQAQPLRIGATCLFFFLRRCFLGM